MAFWKTQFKLLVSLKIGGKLKCCGVGEIFDVEQGCRKTYHKYNHLPSPLGLSSVFSIEKTLKMLKNGVTKNTDGPDVQRNILVERRLDGRL